MLTTIARRKEQYPAGNHIDLLYVSLHIYTSKTSALCRRVSQKIAKIESEVKKPRNPPLSLKTPLFGKEGLREIQKAGLNTNL